MRQVKCTCCARWFLGTAALVFSLQMLLQKGRNPTKINYPDKADIPTSWSCANPKIVQHLTGLYAQDGYFHKMLKTVADGRGRVLLASVDSGYISMALNLLETSIWKHGITSYVFVCSDMDAACTLARHGVDCLVYEQNQTLDTTQPSMYNSFGFMQKTHIKMEITYAALRLGYTVILTDVDVVFLQNPLQHSYSTDCDIAMTSDNKEENSGFFVAYPTAASLRLFERSLQSVSSNSAKKDDQKVINEALKKMKKKKRIKEETLSNATFPNGAVYFEGEVKRYFAGDNPCVDCVILHNNWILGQRAKIYRFREHLMWLVDTDQYYSSADRRYLTYENTYDWGTPKANQDIERETLKHAFAIAYLLNRTLVLPRFTCLREEFQIRCPLNSVVNISNLDQHLADNYRENMFFQHSKVPNNLLNKFASKPIFIKTTANHKVAETINDNDVLVFSTPDLTLASPSDIKNWFITPRFHDIRVLTFHSLYHTFAEGENCSVSLECSDVNYYW